MARTASKKRTVEKVQRNQFTTSRGNNNLLQNEIFRTIKWTHFVQYTAAGLSVQTYRINSLYDPDETGAGVQPVGFDEIMALYYYFRVEKVRIKITVVNGGTAGIVACQLSRESTDPTQITAVAANNSGRSEMIAGTYGHNRSVMYYYVDIKDYLGLKMNVGDDLQGTVSGNPSRMVYLHVALEEIDLSAKDMSLFCEFEFETRFFNPLQLNNS